MPCNEGASLSFFVSEEEGGVFLFKLCLVWRVDCPLVKAKSSQVPDMFREEFPIAHWFCPIYALANVVLLSPIYMDRREGTLCFEMKSSVQEACIVFFVFG